MAGVTRWSARYVNDGGREALRPFDRRADAQQWLDGQLASLLRGEHVAPQDQKLTVRQRCDKWLDGRTRRESTVKIAAVHLKVVCAEFEAVLLSAVNPMCARGARR
ncbi:hypothetical protein [Aeromicrobium piscarium]|uniref:Uncharacterized protein n=1 Tax=Aeromicrobium piscarium TaxID=2590901 RepID=A0A554RN40_9ACTN|nr:hypothetical protein [Aeromicrobium piscarium]TSD55546.1 hypothetical protein FNM00_16675 [Aeromicrobium piscarium]